MTNFEMFPGLAFLAPFHLLSKHAEDQRGWMNGWMSSSIHPYIPKGSLSQRERLCFFFKKEGKRKAWIEPIHLFKKM